MDEMNPKPIDETFTRITWPSINNLPRSSIRRDIIQFDFNRCKDIKCIHILGAGASLEESISKIDLNTSLVVVNQGSLARCLALQGYPHIYVLSDPQPVAAEPLKLLGFPELTAVFASTTAAIPHTRFNTFYFKNMIHNPMWNPKTEYEVFNALLDFADANVSTFVLQVGSVANTSVLIMDFLMNQNKIPRVPVILHGVDCGTYKGKWRCKQYGDKPYPEPTNQILDDDGFTTPAHQEYFKQLKYIHEQLPDLELYTASDNRIAKFLPIWEVS